MSFFYPPFYIKNLSHTHRKIHCELAEREQEREEYENQIKELKDLLKSKSSQLNDSLVIKEDLEMRITENDQTILLLRDLLGKKSI